MSLEAYLLEAYLEAIRDNVARDPKNQFFSLYDLNGLIDKLRVEKNLRPLDLKQWRHTKEVQKLAATIEKNTGSPAMIGATDRHAVTWVHPVLAIHAAMYALPSFKSAVYNHILNLLLEV